MFAEWARAAWNNLALGFKGGSSAFSRSWLVRASNFFSAVDSTRSSPFLGSPLSGSFFSTGAGIGVGGVFGFPAGTGAGAGAGPGRGAIGSAFGASAGGGGGTGRAFGLTAGAGTGTGSGLGRGAPGSARGAPTGGSGRVVMGAGGVAIGAP